MFPGEGLAAETGTGRVGNRQIILGKCAVSSCMAEEQPGEQVVGEGEQGWLCNLVW